MYMYVHMCTYICMYMYNMHHFNHTINNRLKFVYFIRLLLPPRSRINKYQIATNFNTNRPPLKQLIGLTFYICGHIYILHVMCVYMCTLVLHVCTCVHVCIHVCNNVIQYIIYSCIIFFDNSYSITVKMVLEIPMLC
jgi:hypothetical protein